jgi:ABC-2 type transport system permease protein
MSVKRMGILLGKEFRQGYKSFFFGWAVIGPIVISLVFSLLFGTLLSEQPKLGVYDEGSSQIAVLLEEANSVNIKQFDSNNELKQAAENGSVDMGILIPAGFDISVISSEAVEISAYIWGESLAKNRVVIPAAITDATRQIAGQEIPVTIESVPLGDEETVPWSDRILPFIVLMAIVMGGMIIPASSLIEEKQKKTINAVIVSPASITDVFVSKGIMGIILSMVMGTIILVMNQVFGANPALLVGIIFLGALMASMIGLLLGSFLKDLNSLTAVFKMIGLLLYAPAFIYLFPEIPQWIGRIFPTYYLVDPLMAVSQRGEGWSDIALNVFILIGLLIILAAVLRYFMYKKVQYAPS